MMLDPWVSCLRSSRSMRITMEIVYLTIISVYYAYTSPSFIQYFIYIYIHILSDVAIVLSPLPCDGGYYIKYS